MIGSWDYDYTPKACEDCANRERHIYSSECRRCTARMWARSPIKIVRHAIERMSKDMQDLIREEREADQ